MKKKASPIENIRYRGTLEVDLEKILQMQRF